MNTDTLAAFPAVMLQFLKVSENDRAAAHATQPIMHLIMRSFDPASAIVSLMNLERTLEKLKSVGVHGRRLRYLFEDICGNDPTKTLAVLRACEVGLTDSYGRRLDWAIFYGGDGVNPDELQAKLKHVGTIFAYPEPSKWKFLRKISEQSAIDWLMSVAPEARVAGLPISRSYNQDFWGEKWFEKTAVVVGFQDGKMVAIYKSDGAFYVLVEQDPEVSVRKFGSRRVPGSAERARSASGSQLRWGSLARR